MKFTAQRFATCLLAAAMALAAISCTENKPAENKPEGSALTADTKATAAGNPNANSLNSDTPVPPKDSQWTIYCMAISGDGHVLRARQAKKELMAATKMKDWYVVHSEVESVVYYGFYRSIDGTDDASEVKRARQDLLNIKTMADTQGRRPFPLAVFVRQDLPDPTAPPEWDLSQAKGYYSLEIAVYKDSPDRKKVAVESVRAARQMGIEAYYFHGPSTSSVCIGSWPREAVQEENVREVVVKNDDPTRPLLVLPKEIEHMDDREDSSGQSVQAVAPKVVPIDPNLISMMQQYSEHTVNGVQVVQNTTDPKTGKNVQMKAKSFLVVIPRKVTSILGGPTTMPAQEINPLPPPSLSKPVDDGRGKLKSVGD